jgi:hypothetical protein
MKWKRKNGNGNGKKGNCRSVTIGDTLTKRSGRPEQQDYVHGAGPAVGPYDKVQQTMPTTGGWTREASAKTWFTLGGLPLTSADDGFVQEVKDYDVIVDLANPVSTRDDSFTSFTSFNVTGPALVEYLLPKLPIKMMRPFTQCRVIQVVCLRYGEIQTTTFDKAFLPGEGTYGSFGSTCVISQNGRFRVRYRVRLLLQSQPMSFVDEDDLTLSLYSTAAPLVAWERLWKLQLPVQDAYDRQPTQVPMRGAYSFSFKPVYPWSFRMQLGSFQAATLTLATVFNPNTVSSKQHPLRGLVGEIRREPLAVLSSGTGDQILTIIARSPQRIYVFLTDGLSPFERLNWADIRRNLVLDIPGVVGLITMPGLSPRALALAQLDDKAKRIKVRRRPDESKVEDTDDLSTTSKSDYDHVERP